MSLSFYVRLNKNMIVMGMKNYKKELILFNYLIDLIPEPFMSRDSLTQNVHL